jgi:delta 1-pyrroline-5-carboxylate dehydrogenase
MPVMKVKDEAEAVRLANDNRFGLGASIWSNDLARARRVAQQVEAGSILINDTMVQIAIPSLPFGGLKDSGTGRIHGKDGLLSFTTPVTYAVSRTPYRLDLATLMRLPGHYGLGKFLMELLFGVTPRQTLRPFLRWLHLRD